MSYNINDRIPLPNSADRIPRLGFGVYRSPPDQCVKSVHKALDVGYRHIDTAQLYGNEAEVGEALRTANVSREEVFVTSKILVPAGSPEATYEKLVESVEKVGGPGGYVDLFLIHSSKSGSAGRKHLWQALEKLREAGKTKSIGVSNFGVQQIEEMRAYAKVWPPQVNQLELHPWCQQREINDYCRQNDIVVEAYSPIVRNYKANNPTLVEVSQNYNKTTQQVLIRYALQKGWVPLPKTDNADRIAANADLFDFNISAEDMRTLDALDQGAEGAIVEAVVNE
ncbi:aldo-keto reductase [Penicillium angulare]|uniref:aldo-keto reductase n=1 Tax=Penicillium angulare TaxID=116970 RepID=UPI002541D45C|nr:aldo-keto reductase [Penicillium angulare]KAJ5280170.1 aldo-keto reductase [Penicillium angulare]